ncbi:hypothetical protein SprV_0100413500 [Sparganum proliferum]
MLLPSFSSSSSSSSSSSLLLLILLLILFLNQPMLLSPWADHEESFVSVLSIQLDMPVDAMHSDESYIKGHIELDAV